ncbi:MAG: hypothetical protein EZS28_038432, partial [Streblomastix strix]
MQLLMQIEELDVMMSIFWSLEYHSIRTRMLIL